ncbi:MAG TPA: YihY/virulence factor BrkB family protein [Candidatus Saccharimonadales bacterium]|nr:YihY/virulence factor BrkB family protein [Candidatus Saccharimonadales bacterium]
MQFIDTLKERADNFQRTHTVLAFPVAVIKRFGDDEAGKQAALVTYYAFLSLFPLLLIFMTVLNIIIQNNPQLETKIINTVFQLFPALGNDLRRNVGSVSGSGIAIILQLLALLYGARGLAVILQDTFNNLWHIDKKERPGLVGDTLRSFGMMAAVGLGIIIGTTISYTLGVVLDLGIIGAIVINLINILITFSLFLVVFRLGTSSKVGLGKLVVGAAIASIGTLLVQRLGGFIMAEQLPKLEGSYGSFAIALGMLFWIYLQAQIILYALVVTIVRFEHDWPKKLF